MLIGIGNKFKETDGSILGLGLQPSSKSSALPQCLPSMVCLFSWSQCHCQFCDIPVFHSPSPCNTAEQAEFTLTCYTLGDLRMMQCPCLLFCLMRFHIALLTAYCDVFVLLLSHQHGICMAKKLCLPPSMKVPRSRSTIAYSVPNSSLLADLNYFSLSFLKVNHFWVIVCPQTRNWRSKGRLVDEWPKGWMDGWTDMDG